MQPETPAPSLASRADLRAPRGRRYDFGTLPVSGLTVRYRSLSEAEYSAFEMERLERNEEGRFVSNGEQLKTTRARLAVLSLCDADGAPLLTDADVEGIADAWELADSLYLFGKLQDFNGLTGEFDDLAARREAAKKNLS